MLRRKVGENTQKDDNPYNHGRRTNIVVKGPKKWTFVCETTILNDDDDKT